MGDSIRQLEQRLVEATRRDDKVALLNELAYAHRYIDVEKTRDFATLAFDLASQALPNEPPSLDGISLSRVMLCVADIFVGNFEAALLELADIESKFTAGWMKPITHIWASLQLGQCHIGLTNYPTALAYFLDALDLCVEHTIPELEYFVYLGLGSVYAQLEQLDSAIHAEEKAVQLARDLQDSTKIFMATSNLAVSYLERGDAQKALDLHAAALPFFTPDDTSATMTYVDMNRARAYAKLNQLELAEPLIEGVLRVYADGRSKDDLSEALQLRAELFEQAGQFPAALDYLGQALALAEKVGNKDRQADIHERLSAVNRHLGQLAAALTHYEAFHRLRSEIFNQQADLRLKSLEIVHRTAAARQEAELLHLQKAELEERVAIRTRELEQALVREQAIAQELTRALAAEEQLGDLKSKIITTVSHEFRTPLAIISTSVEMLTRYSDRVTPERRSQIEHRIYHAVFTLRDLIQDIVMVDATHNREITPELAPLSFGDFCREMEERMRDDLGYPANLVFHFVPQAAEIWVDEGLMRQVVFDLMSNAVKYSEANQTVMVHLELTDGSLRIIVSDQGIGIPPEDIPRIFQLFFRGSNVSTRSGLGLGLYIVEKLVQAMGGMVIAESAGPDQGSTFRVNVPVKISAAQTASVG